MTHRFQGRLFPASAAQGASADSVAIEESRLKERERFLADVAAGLSGEPKSIPCRWFYDAEGSRLFEAIMRLPEYYPTACETRILEIHKGRLLDALGSLPFHVADLGAGNGDKTRILLSYFRAQGSLLGYAPIDISGEPLRILARALRDDYPGLPITPLQGDYFQVLEDWSPRPAGRRLALFLGSNIGNFEWTEAVAFLSALREALFPGDGVLIGFDLRKDPPRILEAYSDSGGVTARFNLNLLDRINRELGGNFRREDFVHCASYDSDRGVAISRLVARRRHTAFIAAAGLSIPFRTGESIHTESSFKYSVAEIESLARDSGFTVAAHFQDPGGSFLDSLWHPSGFPLR